MRLFKLILCFLYQVAFEEKYFFSSSWTNQILEIRVFHWTLMISIFVFILICFWKKNFSQFNLLNKMHLAWIIVADWKIAQNVTVRQRLLIVSPCLSPWRSWKRFLLLTLIKMNRTKIMAAAFSETWRTYFHLNCWQEKYNPHSGYYVYVYSCTLIENLFPIFSKKKKNNCTYCLAICNASAFIVHITLIAHRDSQI